MDCVLTTRLRCFTRAAAATLVLGLVPACSNSNGSGYGGSSSSGADADAADDDSPFLTADFEPVCEPGTVRCAGGDFIETCAPTGADWTMDACGDNTVCVACGPDDACSEDRCVGACDATTILPSSAGCEFIANRQVHPREDLPDAIVVANPDPERAATVTLYQIAEGTNEEVMVETVTLQPSEDQVWEMNNDFVSGLVSRLRSGGMFRVRSDFPVIAYQLSPIQNSNANESSLLLPDSVLGKIYVVTSYNPHPANTTSGQPSYFEIVTLTKGTVVEWTPPVPTFGTGAPIVEVLAGETGIQTGLNRYDTLRITASNSHDDVDPNARDLSGTVITASEPIWVVGGSKCSHVPVKETIGFCDPLQEVLIPVQHWGTEYVAPHPPLREEESHYWRVYAGGRETTSFTTEPQVLTAENCAPPAIFEDEYCTLPKRGAFIEITVPHGESFVVRGRKAPDDALMVVGYLQSRKLPSESSKGAALRGDPAMYQSVPVAQFLSRYVFRTALGYTDYVEIIRRAGGASVFLDAVGVPVWETVGEYEFASVQITPGAHEVSSSEAFGILQFGYSAPGIDPENCLQETFLCGSSYAHPGGMKSQQIFIP